MNTWAHRRLTAVVLALTVSTLLIGSTGARAATGNQYSSFGQYGEINRIGGFDTAGFDAASDGTGQYDQSKLTAGKFINPAGFTVDSTDSGISTEDSQEPSSDTNGLWVLDRTSMSRYSDNYDPVSSTWRLQKLDDLGHVLGATSFTLKPPSGDTQNDFQVDGLAVDQSTGEVYAEVDERDNADQGEEVPYEIVAWSITPSTGKLVAPSGLTMDTKLFTTDTGSPDALAAPGIVASHTQLTSGPLGSGLYYPEGLAVDDVSGQDQLALVAAGSPASYTGSNAGQSGQTTIVQLIDTSGTVGKLGDYWSAASGLNSASGNVAADSLANDPNADESFLGPAGISAKPQSGGGLTVLLDDSNVNGEGDGSGDLGSAEPYATDVVSLSADLKTEKVIASPTNATNLAPEAASGSLWYSTALDGNAIYTEGDDPPFQPDGYFAAGPEVVALGNGLYAADYADNGPNDPESPSQSNGDAGLGLYTAPAVKLLNPAAESDGTLSNANYPLTSVYDTLGNGATGTCANPGASGFGSGQSFAAGANGVLFDLIRSEDTIISSDGSETHGRQIIEFAPTTGAEALTPTSTDASSGDCPTAAGTFGLSDTTAHGAEQAASDTTPLEAHVGDTVTFDGGAIQYPAGDPLATLSDPHSVPYAFEWNPGTSAAGGPLVDTFTIPSGSNSPIWPFYTQTYSYANPGTYEVKLTLLGDLGTYTEQGAVLVQTSSPPTAALGAASTTAAPNQTVTFDGSGSKPASGAQIANYHWDFGDGFSDDTSLASDTHQYTSPGTYTATLTVRDNDQQQSAPASETVTVTAPAATTTTPAPTTSTPAPTTTTPKPTTTTPTPTTTKPSGSTPGTVSAAVKTAGDRATFALTFSKPGMVKLTATTKVKVKVKVKHKVKTRTKTLVIWSATKAVSAGSTTLALAPSRAAQALLKKHAVKVSVTIAYTPTGAAVVDKTVSLTLAKAKATKQKTGKRVALRAARRPGAGL